MPTFWIRIDRPNRRYVVHTNACRYAGVAREWQREFDKYDGSGDNLIVKNRLWLQREEPGFAAVRDYIEHNEIGEIAYHRRQSARPWQVLRPACCG